VRSISRAMKILLIPFIGLIVFACGKKAENHKPPARKIKTMLETFHDPINRTGEFEYEAKIKEDTYMYSSLFNEDGVLIQKSRFNFRGNLEIKTIFKYDKNGNNIEMISYDSKGNLLSKTINAFDSSGKLIQSDETADAKVISKQTSAVDTAGNRKVTFYERRSGGFVVTLENRFDKNDNNVGSSHYVDGVLKNQEHRNHDANGNVTEYVLFDPSKQEEIITRYEYDKSNRKIGEVVLKNLMVTSKVMFKYDARNNLSDSFTYGMLGNMVVHEKHVYQYDEEGNWTRQTILINNKPTSVIVHQIEYY
jgi:hypothetical protein